MGVDFCRAQVAYNVQFDADWDSKSMLKRQCTHATGKMAKLMVVDGFNS